MAARLLRLVLGGADRDPMLGDLQEQFGRLVRARGEGFARRWYWRQVASCFPASVARRLRRRRSPRSIAPRRRPSTMLDRLRQDLAYALRTLRKEPGWTAAAVLTLALAIAANTAIFGVVNAVLLRPLPYPEPDGLLAVSAWGMESEREYPYMTWPMFQAIASGQDVFQEIGVWSEREHSVVLGDAAERLHGTRISAAALRSLRARPQHGRLLADADDVEGAAGAVLLENGFWHRRFGGDPGIVGTTLRVDEEAYTVVGVMPRGFAFPSRESRFWISMAHADRAPGNWYLQALGRLPSGVAPDRAAARLAALETAAVTNRGRPEVPLSARAVPLRERVVGEFGHLLLLFTGAVGAVLLIACINVVNLFLSRSAGRQREHTVRAALGAGRGRLAQQQLTESTVISLAGAAVGVGLASMLLDTLLAVTPVSLPRQEEIGLDAAAFAFTLVLAVAVGFATGLLPALRSSRPDLVSGLQEGARGASGGRRHQRLRSGLVVAQISLAVVLLFAAGLLLRSFAGLLAVDRGYEVEGVFTFSTSLPSTRYPDFVRQRAFFAELVERLDDLPGVDSVGLAQALPYSTTWVYGIDVEGHVPDADEHPTAEVLFVTPGFFETLRIPLRAGRPPRPDEERGIVVNRTMAHRYWPGGRALGGTLTLGASDPVTVVGIADDVRYMELSSAAEAQAYVPWASGIYSPDPREDHPGGDMAGFLRTSGDPAALAGPVRELIAARDPLVAVSELMPLEERLWDSISEPSFRTLLLGSFGLAALLLAVLGVHGVMAYAVTRRTREIGIRKALGAGEGSLTALVVRRGMTLALAGLALGVAGSWYVGILLESYLFGVDARDPWTLAGVVVLLAGSALAACAIPARRAARVDPRVALGAG